MKKRNRGAKNTLSLHRLPLMKGISYLILILLAVAALFPALFTLAGSFMDSAEIIENYYSDTQMHFTFIPEHASIQNYVEVFLLTPDYLVKFWNSMFLTLSIVAGQLIVSCLGAYGFAKFHFPLKNTMYYLVIVLLMMPFQVTLVPNYIVLDWMGLKGSYWAVILPGIFSPFGVFLLTQVFAGIPDEMLEAAKLDGANQLQILFRIVIPHAKMGIASLAILSFIDNWNMVEQPLVFLKDSTMHPLSIFLSRVNEYAPDKAFVCGVLAMIPVVLLFLFLKDALVKGIEYANMK